MVKDSVSFHQYRGVSVRGLELESEIKACSRSVPLPYESEPSLSIYNV